MELDRTILKKIWNGEKVLCPKCNEDYFFIVTFKELFSIYIISFLKAIESINLLFK